MAAREGSRRRGAVRAEHRLSERSAGDFPPVLGRDAPERGEAGRGEDRDGMYSA